MGCLNSGQGFSHWFANIHLSGPCNRSCYFCIGQHMMALDSENNLKQWPLRGFDEFIAQCEQRNVRDVYLTGTNTDAMLYHHSGKIKRALPSGMRLGFRTNGVALKSDYQLSPFDMGSITLCSTNPDIYARMMGNGVPPDLDSIAVMAKRRGVQLKVNIVLGPENVGYDLMTTIGYVHRLGINRINLREPYGQPRIGDPLTNSGLERLPDQHGSPTYRFGSSSVTYWDVHYVEVESVNLYANGTVSLDYPITRGHDISGQVNDQSKFTYGRHAEQWQNQKRLTVVQ